MCYSIQVMLIRIKREVLFMFGGGRDGGGGGKACVVVVHTFPRRGEGSLFKAVFSGLTFITYLPLHKL